MGLNVRVDFFHIFAFIDIPLTDKTVYLKRMTPCFDIQVPCEVTPTIKPPLHTDPLPSFLLW